MTPGKWLFTLMASSSILASAVGVASANTSTVMTTDQAVSNYNANDGAYTKDELMKVDQYRTTYQSMKNSLADQLIERAVWYMNNGYMVYGHGLNSYANQGIVDCSAYVKLVYRDFSFPLPGNPTDQSKTGTSVTGVYSTKVNGVWKLQGTENLLPGDILSWWAIGANGQKYITHTAIFMGSINGQPAVIGTRGPGNPTAIGIVNDFRWWWGEHFNGAQRVLPAGSWTANQTISNHTALQPVIPQSYVLPPQKPVVMPDGQPPQTSSGTSSTSNQTASSAAWTAASPGDTLVVQKALYLRKAPTLGFGNWGLIPAGSRLTVLSQYNKYNFYVQTPSGQKGYITTWSTYTSKP